MTIVSQLKKIVGKENVTDKRNDLLVYGLDWTRFHEPEPVAIVFVRTIDQVIKLVRFARKKRIGLVPSGGRTGLSGGACATNGEVVVSFKKMNRVLGFSRTDASITVQPGVITANLQNYVQEKGFFYPVDFASSGSSHIGGNVATNAGGIRVLRYGMTRDWVSGLKVVTGAGEVINLNKGLIKNNTGYDLRHLFIGSEGTLGFVVEATLQLAPPIGSLTVVLLSIPMPEACLEVLGVFREFVTLTAFEFFSHNALHFVVTRYDLKTPFKVSAPFYILLEFESSRERALSDALEACSRCSKHGSVLDAIVASNEQQNRSLWQYREKITESITHRTPYKNDISLKVSCVPRFLLKVQELIEKNYPSFEIVWFGHVGDGNLHLNILRPEEMSADRFKIKCREVNDNIIRVVLELEGSISAEHGIGLLKKEQLHFTHSQQDIETLKSIKLIFDPDGIMNPGKLLEGS